MQNINTNICRLFQTYFYETLFFPNSDSILQKRQRLTYDIVEESLRELFTTNTNKNKEIIKQYTEQKKHKIED